MKNFKKLLSIILIVAMILSMGMTIASAETVDESLIFDMDMSTTAFADKTGNVINVANTGSVPVKYYKGYDGSTVPYAYFKNGVKNCLSISYNQYAEGAKKSIKNKQTTVEMWARIDAVGKNGADFFTARISSVSKELFTTASSFWVAELTAKGVLYNDALRTSAKNVNMTNAGINHKEWNHYVFTRDVTVDENGAITSVTYKTYINGVEKITNTGTPNETTIDNDTTNVYFGSSIKNNSMAGGISEVKIYNTVKTASEIKALYKEDEGIYRDKAIVDFNPTTIADSKGLIKTLSSNSRYTLPVAKTWVNPSSGEVVPYMSLEVEDSINGNYGIGIGQGEIKGGDITKLTKLPETSVEMWLKHEHSSESSGSPVPFSFGGRIGFWLEMGARNGRKDAYIMLRNGSDDILLEKNYTGIPEKDDDPYNDWVHVVITRKWDKEAGTVDFTGYVDGTPMAAKIPQLTEVTDISADVTEVSFGDGWNVESFYDGGFAKVKIYDTILTAQRVADIYNEEKSSFREFGSEQLVQIEFTDNEGIVMPRVNGSNNEKYYWKTINAVSGSFKSVAGPTVVYSDYNAAPYGDIAIDSSNQAEAMTAVSANSATIEMWVRPENVTVDKPTTLFSVNQNAAGNPATQGQWRAGITNGELKLYGAGETNSEYKGTVYSGTDISSYYGQWIHLLFTRDVDTAVNSVVYKAYINGELAQTKIQSATTLSAENSIYINTKQNKNYGMNEFSTFQGDVANFKLYSGTTNSDFALFKYNKEKDLYTVAPDEKITVSGVGFYTDDDYVEEFPVNAELLGVEATLTNSTEEDKAYLFAVGIYDGNKLVDLFMINDTVNNLGSPYIEIEDLSQYNLSQNAYVKLFVWYDGEDNGLIPCESNEEVMEISAQGGA